MRFWCRREYSRDTLARWSSEYLSECREGAIASVRLAGCEGSYNLVNARFKSGDRECLLKKWKCEGVPTHRLVIIDTAPLRIHRHLCAVYTAMEAGRNKTRRLTD